MLKGEYKYKKCGVVLP